MGIFEEMRWWLSAGGLLRGPREEIAVPSAGSPAGFRWPSVGVLLLKFRNARIKARSGCMFAGSSGRDGTSIPCSVAVSPSGHEHPPPTARRARRAREAGRCPRSRSVVAHVSATATPRRTSAASRARASSALSDICPSGPRVRSDPRHRRIAPPLMPQRRPDSCARGASPRALRARG